jgi:two-component system OmpR family response regulator
MSDDQVRILLVEDEEHLAVGIKYNLEAEGFQVTATGDGQSALTHIEADGSPDLVILDLMLPGMSGYKVCETIRASGLDTPVLILSARTLPEDRAQGFDVGADQYLTKPFELDELIARVKNLLARHARRQADPKPKLAQVEFGKAVVNFATHQITVAGIEVKMTALEMKLLEYFVQNEGRVIPRGELLENVWEMPGNINTRAPDQIIRRLRKTFEENSAEPRHFVTIRDAGYRFVASCEPSE